MQTTKCRTDSMVEFLFFGDCKNGDNGFLKARHILALNSKIKK